MANRYTNHFIDSELQRLSTHKDPFLKNGYMGLCLFLFAMYELTAAERYFDLAQQCLRLSCSTISKKMKSQQNYSIKSLRLKGWKQGKTADRQENFALKLAASNKLH